MRRAERRWGALLAMGWLGIACGEPDAPPADGTTEAGDDTTGAASTAPDGTTSEASSDGLPPADTTDSGPDAESTSTGGDTTGDGSGTTAAGSTGTAARCPQEHECFFLDGEFHTADEANPTFIHSLPVKAAEFAAVEVELDVVHGGWYPDDPGGLHNIFWLHRGQFDNFTWAGGVAGYVNARGPGTNIVRTRHDLDVTDLADSETFNINGVALAPGSTYHVFYRYDAAASLVTVEVTENDAVVAQGTDVPTTDLVRNNDNGFFIYFANGTDVEQPGPEVPSLGWTFSDLRVEFIPQ